MEFRPCIDIHNGKVKQIIGGSLKDQGDFAQENFVSREGADYYARLYRDAGIKGGHVIMLNGRESDYYGATKQQAVMALRAYPGGLQVGGGIQGDNAGYFLNEGASHVIVTSYVFRDGVILYERLQELKKKVGKKHLVLDVSCRRRGDDYYVVTDRWQKMTDEKLSADLLEKLSEYCDEFLVHAVDVEGKSGGIDELLIQKLCEYKGLAITYAGGVHDYDDIARLGVRSAGRFNVTVGSALDLFGGRLSWKEVQKICSEYCAK